MENPRSPPLLSSGDIDELAPLASPFFSIDDVRAMAVTWSDHVARYGPASALPVFKRAFAAIEEQLGAMPESAPLTRHRLHAFHAAVLARIAQRLQ